MDSVPGASAADGTKKMFFTWNDRRIHFVDEGSGPALLFLHGLGGNADNWLNQRRVFERTRRVLSLGFSRPRSVRRPRRGIS